TVEKNKLGMPGRCAELSLAYPRGTFISPLPPGGAAHPGVDDGEPPRLPALVLPRPERGEQLADRPLVVGGHPSERKPVRAASVEARAFGVCAGMPLRQAEQLCPEALFFPADPAAESSLARHLLAGLYALAPRVELAVGGEAYVEVDGLGEPVAFASRVGAYLHQRLRSRPALGLGSNKFVAHIAAGLAAGAAIVDGELAPRLVPCGRDG